MNALDLSPLFRGAIGFDQLEHGGAEGFLAGIDQLFDRPGLGFAPARLGTARHILAAQRAAGMEGVANLGRPLDTERGSPFAAQRARTPGHASRADPRFVNDRSPRRAVPTAQLTLDL